jgi:hypothetical protein
MDTNWPLYVRKRHGLVQLQIAESATADTAIKWLYDVLTTLDSKASALMRLNGILIAASAFLLGIGDNAETFGLTIARLDAQLIVSCALLSALSIFACLFVVNVSWPFLGKTMIHETGVDCMAEMRHLDKACAFRQRMYRGAWYLSLLASVGFLWEFGSQALGVFGLR